MADQPHVGIALTGLRHDQLAPVAETADELGFESVWLSEHLVLPAAMTGSPFDDEHPPIPPTLPVYDAFAALCHVAACAPRVRLGTWVYLLGLRHPFVAARAVTTLDILSGGRAVVGVGAGWMREEFEAAGEDFSRRGRLLDEAIEVCSRLWDEPVVEHAGDRWSFPPVAFEPKPVQRPRPPLLVGGESPAALRRAARLGDGWIGMGHTPQTAAQQVDTLRGLVAEAGGDGSSYDVTVGATDLSADDLDRWAQAGVTRVIVRPWRRGVDPLQRLAAVANRLPPPEGVVAG